MSNIFGVTESEEPKNEPIKENLATSDIDDLLSGYKDVSLKDNSMKPEGTKTSDNLFTQQPANPDVYLSGKKVGQPRKPRVGYKKQQEQTSLSGEILTGALFITMIDLCLPMIITGLNNRFSKQKMKASDLSLTAKQKSELAPIADKVVKQFDFNANPNALLLFSILGIYGANFAMVKLSNPTTHENNTKNHN